jgi:lysozyme family protein
MAHWNYDPSLKRVLAHEGGYTNDKNDPGGPTNFGITIIDYRKYVKADATAADVRAMNVDEAKEIYEAKYWNAMRCDELPSGIDYCVFDYGVNSGIGRAPKVLQRVLGIEADGKIGPITLAAVAKADPQKVVSDICRERLAFLRSLAIWPTFGKGWTTRVNDVERVAIGMTTKRPPPDVTKPVPAAPQGWLAFLLSLFHRKA